MKKLIQILEGFIMKKFLLVVFIGMVLAINLYGFATDIIKAFEEVEEDNQVGTVVYVE
jgi:4-hydroxybenzoate polyprenyltransferase